ncbi:tryptophan RNA-binding attenuation protein [Paenibacillus lautus]|uniref:tryptophan RNA-binding attenuation protein n=1 Tax=Paenibacillus lautus TaxID=1401 RepID=UPI0038505639
MSVIIAMDDLELPCPNCKGEKHAFVNNKKEPCSKCDGKGVILTALGQTLLHFFKKHS